MTIRGHYPLVFIPYGGFSGGRCSLKLSPGPNPHRGQELAEQWAQIAGQPHFVSQVHLRRKKKGDKEGTDYGTQKNLFCS